MVKDNPAEQLRKRLADTTAGSGSQAISPLGVTRTETFQLSLGDLRAACATNPKHPVALVYARACLDHEGQDLSDNRTVAVDRMDLQALMDDGHVKSVTKLEKLGRGQVRVTTKEVVPKEEAPGDEPKESIPHKLIPGKGKADRKADREATKADKK